MAHAFLPCPIPHGPQPITQHKQNPPIDHATRLIWIIPLFSCLAVQKYHGVATKTMPSPGVWDAMKKPPCARWGGRHSQILPVSSSFPLTEAVPFAHISGPDGRFFYEAIEASGALFGAVVAHSLSSAEHLTPYYYTPPHQQGARCRPYTGHAPTLQASIAAFTTFNAFFV